MQGSLKQVPLPEVLQFISMGKSSGVLQLRKDSHEITLSIHNGKIINSSSMERRRRIGDLLVNRGLLKRSELSRLLNIQKTVESDKRLGQILVEREVVTEETIRETLRLQLEEEIWSLFAWDDGEFKFETIDPKRLGDAIVQIDIEPMILEGTRRNDEWQKILTVLPHDGLVLNTAPPDDNFERHLKLRPQEWRVLSQVNGRFTVQAVVNRSNMGRFEVHLILSQFIKSGLLLVDEEATGRHRSIAEQEGDEDEQEKAPSKGAQERGGIFGGLIGGKGKEKGDSRVLEFVSPIGALTFFQNEMVRRITSLKEYSAGPGDKNVLERIWYELVQTYTRADLLKVRRNVVDSKEIESFFEKCEFVETIDECYEDALEGLMSLMQASYRHFTQAVGERSATKVVRDLMDEVGSRINVMNRGPFPFVERVQTVLKVAG